MPEVNNSVYTTLASQVALNDELSIVSNNTANVNTDGFKKDIQIMSSHIAKDKIANIKMPNDIASISDFTPGALKQTEKTLDVAINGQGFFMVQTPNGVRYTRNGHFLTNSEGTLIDMQGNPVLSQDGAQTLVPAHNENIFINKKGKIYASEIEIGSIGVVDFSTPNLLRKTGNGYFMSDIEADTTDKYQILQGFIEESNTNPIIETTKLIELQKKFSMNSTFISDIYSMQANAYKTISK